MALDNWSLLDERGRLLGSAHRKRFYLSYLPEGGIVAYSWRVMRFRPGAKSLVWIACTPTVYTGNGRRI